MAAAAASAGPAPAEPLKICTYTYKGGAAKSTITINVAAALANAGKKVLQIDLDPQCNTTQFWNDDEAENASEASMAQASAAAAGLMHMQGGAATGAKLLSDDPHLCRMPSDMAAFVGKTHEKPLYNVMNQLLCFSDANEMKKELDKPGVIQVCNPDSYGDRLWLLAGTPLLSEFESVLSQALGAPDVTPHKQQYVKIGIISTIIGELVRKYSFDVVLIDVSPSNSALNEVAALSCDYILPPCQASLYSCGSIYGMLTSVLPGPNGWFGKHTRLAAEQWADKTDEYISWRLPREPPKLLPILVNNYGMEIVTTKEGKPTDRKQMRFAQSQFYYTLEKWVPECEWVDGPGANATQPKVIFEPNCGRLVIPFAPSVPVSIAASEALGRAFVELTHLHFQQFYSVEEIEQPQKKKKQKKGNNALMKALHEAGDLGADEVFKKEVELMKTRFEALAQWLIELLDRKRSTSSSAAGPSSSSGPGAV